MIIALKQIELFQLLQTEKFIIGQSLLEATKSLMETSSNRTLIEISKHHLNNLVSNYTILKNKWKKLQGGRRRSAFLLNLKNNILLKIDEADFDELESNTINNKINETIEPASDETSEKVLTNLRRFSNETQSSLKKKRWLSNKRKAKRNMRAKIQEYLTSSNNFLKELGLCFKKIEIIDTSLHTYNNSFKLVNKKNHGK